MSSSRRTKLGAMPLLPLLLNAALGFKLCPSSCLCYESSDLVDCRSRELLRVPPSVPHDTWLLDLSGNKLMVVRTRSFVGLWSLRILLMSNNSIQTLQPQVPRYLNCVFSRAYSTFYTLFSKSYELNLLKITKVVLQQQVLHYYLFLYYIIITGALMCELL